MKKDRKLVLKRAISILSGLVLLLILVNGIAWIQHARVTLLTLMWDLVCVTVLVFIKVCQKNIINKVDIKGLAIVIVTLAIILTLVMIMFSTLRL